MTFEGKVHTRRVLSFYLRVVYIDWSQPVWPQSLSLHHTSMDTEIAMGADLGVNDVWPVHGE